jgi:hypothetical protein
VRAAVERLRQAHARDAGVPRVAPVVDAPALDAVVQEAVAGEELHQVVFDAATPGERRAALASAAAAALEGLHTVPATAPAPPAPDLDEVRACEPAVRAGAAGAVHARYVELSDEAERRVRALPPVEAVTGHGAFRTDQFLVDAAGLVLIDLDSVGPAHPAQDVANLLAYVDWRRLRRPGDAAACDVVAASFRATAVAGPEAVDAHRALALLKVAGRRYRSVARREWDLVPAVLDEVTRALGPRAIGANEE